MIAVFDTETIKSSDMVQGGWDNIDDFGLAVCVLATSTESGELYFERSFIPFGDNTNIAEMSDVALMFDSPDLGSIQETLDSSERIVTFNGERFDFEVMNSAGFDADQWIDKSFDILARFEEAAGHRISLNDLAKSLFKESKTMEGVLAPDLWQGGLELVKRASILRSRQAVRFSFEYLLDEQASALTRAALHLFQTVVDYCKHDVELTYRIYEKLKESGGEIQYYSKRTRGRLKIQINMD